MKDLCNCSPAREPFGAQFCAAKPPQVGGDLGVRCRSKGGWPHHQLSLALLLVVMGARAYFGSQSAGAPSSEITGQPSLSASAGEVASDDLSDCANLQAVKRILHQSGIELLELTQAREAYYDEQYATRYCQARAVTSRSAGPIAYRFHKGAQGGEIAEFQEGADPYHIELAKVLKVSPQVMDNASAAELERYQAAAVWKLAIQERNEAIAQEYGAIAAHLSTEPGPVASGEIKFSLKNSTPAAFTAVYSTPASTNRWGNGNLLQQPPLAPGAPAEITIQVSDTDCIYDLRAERANNRPVVVKGIDMCRANGQLLTISADS